MNPTLPTTPPGWIAGDAGTLWRAAPGFHQRLTGTFSEDGRTITGRRDGSRDGPRRTLDRDLTYRKVS